MTEHDEPPREEPAAPAPAPAPPGAQQQRKRRLAILAATLVAAATVVGLAIGLSGGGGGSASTSAATTPTATGTGGAAAPPSGPPGTADVAKLLAGIPQHGITLGAPSAPVTLVEYADLKCPVCREYSLTLLPQLIARYVRTGKVKMVFRTQHFIGEQEAPGDSLAAARMAQAAGLQDRMWTFAELFYVNQGAETSRYATDAFLRRLGSGVRGLDVGRALAQRGSAEVRTRIAQADALFDRNRFTGTPSFQLARSGAAMRTFEPTSFALSAFSGPIDALLAK
jgi:protein-disulfide isomerase